MTTGTFGQAVAGFFVGEGGRPLAPQPDSGSPDDQQLIAKRLHGRALPE
jgi:hypothetical protein